MRARPDLTLHEEILLLALDDEKGTAGIGGSHRTAMAGAILADLLLGGAVTVGDDKKKLLDPVPGATVDDPVLADCLALIRDAKRRRRARDWVMKFANLRHLQDRTARGLVAKGVLREDKDKVLGIFPRVIFPERDAGPEQDLRKRLHHAVFTSSPNVDERTVVVAVLANATGLLNRVFDKKRLKDRKQRLQKLAEGRVAGAATREAIEAMQAAVLAATIAATAAASSAATH